MDFEEDLEAAILRSKTGDSPEAPSAVDLVARVMRIPAKSLVHAALYALKEVEATVTALRRTHEWFHLSSKAPDNVSEELRNLLRLAVRREVVRALFVQAIVEQKPVSLDVQSVLPLEKVADICRGCPRSMECLADGLSTPEQCYHGVRYSRYIDFVPQRIDGQHVIGEMEHPSGVQRLSLLRLAQDDAVKGLPE